MKKIIAISGSLRKKSYNTALLTELSKYAPQDCKFEMASIADIPLYNADLEEAKGIPAAVRELKEKILNSDALLISTPEYNHAIPGVLKNAIDWLSRPAEDIQKIFHNRPTGIVGVSAGSAGAYTAQIEWLAILKYFKVKPYFENSLSIGSAYKVFDQEGKIHDETILKRLQKYIQGFAKFIQDAS